MIYDLKDMAAIQRRFDRWAGALTDMEMIAIYQGLGRSMKKEAEAIGRGDGDSEKMIALSVRLVRVAREMKARNLMDPEAEYRRWREHNA